MIYTENTPNPNAVKFLSNKVISEIGTKEFQKEKIDKIKNEFVKNLLRVEGVELILFSKNFLSVKKEEKASWDSIKPTVISHLNDYFSSKNDPILSKQELEVNHSETVKSNNEVINQINEVLDTKIRPAVAKDGGDIKFVSFENGIVKVQLKGSCSGCPSSLMTLKQGVQNLLKHYVKEVNSVEAN